MPAHPHGGATQTRQTALPNVAYASEMEARWEYRRLVWRAQMNSEIYGLSPPAAPVPIATWNRRETLIWGL